ncbi:uncharacterized protein [Venturia canescens]|uniref:uncharacterized protein n=1 Tax=Venturia canescens TaxID=32260 RepID=UPI001C9D3BD9|nr:uncharacterized protein LOC122407120 [Venturia canescens]
MAESCVVELDTKYVSDDETCLSDDLDVSVANMNRIEENKEIEKTLDTENEESCTTTGDIQNDEIVSDDEYNYSDDSVCSDDSCRDSEVTNVTPRSSLQASSPLNRTISQEYPMARIKNMNRDEQSDYPRQFSVNIRDNVRRMCSSANDNRYCNRNVVNFDSTNSRPKRRNMSFTNAEMRRIEVENQYLLKKIMAQQKPQNKPIRTQSAQPRMSSSAINRKKLQKRIEQENMMLLRRIQGAKSCAVSSNVIPGYRLTSL